MLLLTNDPLESKFIWAGDNLLALQQGGLIAFGIGIIIFDIVTVPTGEGMAGVYMIGKAVGAL